MFRWIKKLKIWRKTEKGPLIHDHGRYVYKPVIARALSVVTGVSQAEVCSWVENPEISVFLNDALVQGASWARERLESGSYEIKIPSQNKVWRFFIA